MKHLQLCLVPVVILLLVFSSAQTLTAKEITKTFKAVGNVKIKVVSGNCTIATGSGNEIKVTVKYTYSDDDYKPVFQENGNTLVLKEDFLKNNDNVRQGESDWRITVPAETAIECSTASGNFQVSGLRNSVEASLASGNVNADDITGKLEVKTASGNITLVKINGDIEAGTASGNIKMQNVTGEIEAKAASGQITAEGVTLTGKGEFKVASGNISLSLAKSPEHNLEIKTASGDLLLDYNGNELKGSFEIKGMKENVSVPSEFKEERNKYSAVGKWFYVNGNAPEIEMKSSSGSITLKK